MRVFITGWLNSQYLPGIKRYASRTAIYFPLVATRMRACSSTVSPRNSEFFDILKKHYPKRNGRSFIIQSHVRIEWVTRRKLITTFSPRWPLKSNVSGELRSNCARVRANTTLWVGTWVDISRNFTSGGRSTFAQLKRYCRHNLLAHLSDICLQAISIYRKTSQSKLI